MLRGCSLRDIDFLIRFEQHCSKVTVYNFDQQILLAYEHGLVPWQVIFLLTRHAHKHIYHSRKLPQLCHWMEHAKSSINKLCWRWSLHNRSSHDDGPAPKRTNRCLTPECSVRVDAGLVAWCSAALAALARGFQRARSKTAGLASKWANTPRVVMYAFKFLPKLDWCPVITDKTKEWSLVPRQDIPLIHNKLLHAANYTDFDIDLFPQVKRQLYTRFYTLAKKSVKHTIVGPKCSLERLLVRRAPVSLQSSRSQ